MRSTGRCAKASSRRRRPAARTISNGRPRSSAPSRAGPARSQGDSAGLLIASYPVVGVLLKTSGKSHRVTRLLPQSRLRERTGTMADNVVVAIITGGLGLIAAAVGFV